VVTAHDGIDAVQFAEPIDKIKACESLGLPKKKK
jgi:hypothetical protein